MPFISERPQGANFRTLIVLLDGTGDSIDVDITNIVHLKHMLYGSYHDDDKQMVLYLRGIGSQTDGFEPKFDDERPRPPKGWFKRNWDKAFVPSFSEYVLEPYKWLCKHYRTGDKICIFGFSRGAYTARVLAGIINALGLLPKENATPEVLEAAYKVFDNLANLPPQSAGKEVMDNAWIALQNRFNEFKEQQRCLEAYIEFLGCWDTVNSVGYLRPVKLGFTRTNDIVRTFRHAISLDEHRTKFKHNKWSDAPKPKSADEPKAKVPRVVTDVEEVWFAGCHCDVGGGSVPNGTRPNLAHIPLRWMIRECFKRNSGMIFDADALKVIGIDASSIDAIVKPRLENSSFSSGSAKISVVDPEGWGAYLSSFIWSKESAPQIELEAVLDKTEEELDAIDALAPAYDQLTLKPVKWGAMEYIWIIRTKPDKNGKWQEIRERNLYRGRTISPPAVSHGGKIKVHRSVKIRMEAEFESGPEKGKKYVPLARIGYGSYEEKATFDKAVERGWVEWVA